MMAFRFQLLALAAVFLALAGGIALGAGPLQDPVEGQLAAASPDGGNDEKLEDELRSARELSDFSSAYSSGTAGLVVGDRLAGTSVSLLLLPGADPAVADKLVDNLGTAGARVTSTVTVTDGLLDPAQRQLAESLVEGLLDSVDGVQISTAASGYERVGSVLGQALVTDAPGSAEADGAADSIVAAFEEAGFVEIEGSIEQRASLALLVAGDPPADAPEGQAEVVSELAMGINGVGGGTVVAGTTGSAVTGAVAALRASDARTGVSTVDGIESIPGRLATVLALVEQAAGGTGDYGPSGADGAVPTVSGRGDRAGGGADG
jgi:hypothetical protein